MPFAARAIFTKSMSRKRSLFSKKLPPPVKNKEPMIAPTEQKRSRRLTKRFSKMDSRRSIISFWVVFSNFPLLDLSLFVEGEKRVSKQYCSRGESGSCFKSGYYTK